MNPFLALVQTQSKPRGGVNYDKPIGPPAPKRESYQDQLSRLQNAGKSRTREDEQLDAILKGDFNKAKQIRDNDRAKKRAARGDVKTVAQKKTETPGTWNNSVAQARKRLGIKQGEDLDSLLKSALWVYRYSDADETTSKAEIDDVVRMMQSPEGRNELKARIERFRNPQKPEQQVKAGNLSESELEAKRREFEFQDSMDASGLGKTFRTIEDSQAKIESNPFLQMASKTAGALAETATLPGIALNAAGVDVAGITEDVTKSAVSGTLTTPARIPANLMKLVSGGVPIEQRGYALAELIADALDVGGLTGMALKANKAGIKEVVKALAEEAVKAGNVAEDVIEQAVKAIDDIPKEQLDEITYSFRQPENVGGDVGAEFRPNNNKSVISESPPGSTQSANTKPAQDEAGFFNARSAPNYTWKVDDFAKIPDAGREVDGLVVRESVPNMDSIEASIENATEIGVKAVPMSWFEDTVRPLANASRDAHVEDLAKQIAESGEVNPLIVVLDGDGKPYILEGAHRFEALLRLGKNQFPALVVRDEDSMFGALRKAIKSGNDVPLDVIDEYLEFYNASTIQEDGLLYPMIRHRQNTGGKPLVPQEQLRNFVQSEVSKGNNVPDDIKEIAGLGDAKVTQNIADDLPTVTDTAADVPKAVKVPDELKGKVDETFLGKKADEWERRLAELQAKPKKPRTKESGGLDPDVLEEAVLRAGILMARAGEPIEQAIRATLKQMGLGDESFEEVRSKLDGEFESVGFAQGDTAKIRAERGAPQYERTTQSLGEVAQNAESVDIQRTVRDVLDNPRPMTSAEEYATRQAFDANDQAYRELTSQYNQAIESEDFVSASILSDELDKVNSQLEELAQAADVAGTEWGRSGRARQLEIVRSREPSVIRYRQYKAVGGKPSAADKKRIDDLIAELDNEKAAREAAEAKLASTRKARVTARVQTVRPPRKIEQAIQENDKAFAEWQKRWAKAGTGGKTGGGTTVPLAFEGAYYITKGQLLRGVKSLDDLVSAVRKAGLTEDDISTDDIISQVEKAIEDTTPKRKPSKKPTIQDLRNEIAKRTGRVKERQRAPRKPKEGNTPKARAEQKYRTTVDSLQKEIERLQAQVSLHRAADPDGPALMKLREDLSRLAAKVNRGRVYGKDVLQVGNVGFDGDEVLNLRTSLDNLKRDLGFDEQAINAPGESYGNIIKNIEDIEADQTLSPRQKLDKLKEQYKILNQGRTDGEGVFVNGQYAIEDPTIARARAREDAAMAKINKELAKQKRKAEREAMSKMKRFFTSAYELAGGIKTLALSGESGFIGRQAWTAIGTGRFKTFGNALTDMKNSVKEDMFDWTIAELKQNPLYEKAQEVGLQISDPSARVREEDFMPEIFDDWADSSNKALSKTGQALSAYSGLNERLYTSFINRVRMDLFQEFVESASLKGTLTDKDLEAFANIVNDMTGKSKVPPKAEQAVSVMNHLLISTKYYLSRLKLVTGSNLYTGGSPAAKKQMAKEYARFMGVYGTLIGTAAWANEKFDLGMEVTTDMRATDFGKIILSNGASLEFDAGTRPFINFLWRNGINIVNDLGMKTGEDREPSYVSGKGNEFRDSDYGAFFATKLGSLANFISIRSNPIPRFFLQDLSSGESFGNQTNIYKEAATAPVPIIGKNAVERAVNEDPADAQAMAFLLEFFGLGGDAIDRE